MRLLAPGAVLGLAACSVIGSGAASDTLPDADAARLIAALQHSVSTPLSGTLLAQVALGLPKPTADRLSTLPDGSHTMRLWYGGPERQRVALFGPGSETDVFRSGDVLWRWDSDQRVATRSELPVPLPETMASLADAPLQFAALTPGLLCRRALHAIDAATAMQVLLGRRIADRPTYELVLTPDDPLTRIAAVHIEVDGARKVPLGVQVYAQHVADPVIDVVFTSVTFKAPADDYFSFRPPPGATVNGTARSLSGPGPHGAGQNGAGQDGAGQNGAGQPPSGVAGIRTIGSGWSAVAGYPTGTSGLRTVVDADEDGDDPPQTVLGDWGSGRLVMSPLLCLLETGDGTVYIGPVDPSALYAAAAGNR
jgi:outer membrane lipoprotein-sorting protein